MVEFPAILIGLVLANEFLLRPPLALPRHSDAERLSAGLALTLSLVLAAVLSWGLQSRVLAALGMPELALVVVALAAITATASVTRLVDLAGSAATVRSVAIVNCANCMALAVLLLVTGKLSGLASAITWAIGTGLGFALATVLFASLRERLAAEEVPAPVRGPAIALVTAAFLALALTGMAGILRD